MLIIIKYPLVSICLTLHLLFFLAVLVTRKNLLGICLVSI
jgi:hypothetical protein